jgi:hypothetical protein
MRQWLGNPTAFQRVRDVFLLNLALIYAVAFISFGVQVTGLVGEEGIIPAKAVLDAVRDSYQGAAQFAAYPSLLWLDASDAFLQALCLAGAIGAVLWALNIAPSWMAALVWLIYLSLVMAGNVFMAFQWDKLLLEAGFLAIFLAPPALRPARARRQQTPLFIIWLYRWLLFRLMFGSGIVKLMSGDPTWSGLTALAYHYQTQPLPNPLAWYAHHLPYAFHQLATLATLLIELIVPFAYFGPRRLRLLGAAITAGFQVLIALTGNYTYFNWLTIALCIPLLDDQCLGQRTAELPPRWWGYLTRGSGVVLLALSVMMFSMRLFALRWPEPLSDALRYITHWGIVNNYGLFAVMTTERLEIIIEGSEDGQHWRAYRLPYQPHDIYRPPPVVAPHQPRLDWQMWFAALGNYRQNGWFINLMKRTLEGAPSVLALYETNPFPDEPPRFIRATLYEYRFSTPTERAQSGAWWARSERGLYFPAVARDDF